MRLLFFLILLFSFQVTKAEVRIIIPINKGVIMDNGKCYEKAEDPETGIFHWVPCDGADNDLGFNKPNCGLIGGLWRESDQSCLQEILSEHGLVKRYRWYLKDGEIMRRRETHL